MSARDDYPYSRTDSGLARVAQYEAMCDEIDRLRRRVELTDRANEEDPMWSIWTTW